MMKKLDGSPGRETSLQVVNRSWGEHRSKCVDLAVLRRFLPIPIVALTGGLINAPQGSSAAALPGPLLFLGERFPAASGAVRILRIAGQIHLQILDVDLRPFGALDIGPHFAVDVLHLDAAAHIEARRVIRLPSRTLHGFRRDVAGRT
jgi:hypothetical protein